MTTFDQFIERYRRIADLGAASSTLHWDQETLMPPKAAQGRAEQLATIDALVHSMVTSSDYSDLLGSLASDGDGLESWHRAAVREARRAHDRATKLPTDFVAELSRTQSLGQHSWKEAREKADFEIFAPILEKLVGLKRQEAAFYGAEENLYDALIEDYEPGMTASQLVPVFDRLRQGTTRLLKQIADSGVTIDNSFWYREYDGDTQLAVARKIVEKLGFDFQAGRVDLSAHPFCTSFGIDDVRLTTRIRPEEPAACIFGLIHESGHGMYEQGIDRQFARTPLATGVSMGIHESQSLFWENMIGRSEAFWKWAFPVLVERFPSQLAGLNPYQMFRGVNVMKPSFIRVESDELTYNLHIVLRFEMENALINDRLQVNDIPAEWNRRMEQYLGIVPPNDALGCLQDVHWSFGLFGYFPSYTLGKLYSAMFYNQMNREVADVQGSIARGDFTPVLGWLREKIHHWGRSLTASELVTSVCERPLTEVDFLEYISEKISRVYTRD